MGGVVINELSSRRLLSRPTVNVKSVYPSRVYVPDKVNRILALYAVALGRQTGWTRLIRVFRDRMKALSQCLCTESTDTQVRGRVRSMLLRIAIVSEILMTIPTRIASKSIKHASADRRK